MYVRRRNAVANNNPEMEFLNNIVLVEVSGHKLESSQTRIFVWFCTLIFLFYKMLFMNKLSFLVSRIFL